MSYYERALELRAETSENRRYFHTNAETGLDVVRGKARVMAKLAEYGLEPRDCGHGVTAEVGRPGGRTILLRADMDALPMPEESGEPFACPTGTECHACGHDLHAAMLLTAARLLKENEAALQGTVRLMFQPAEETFEGSKDMIAHGILDGVDVALAYHVTPGRMPIGMYLYNDSSTMMYSVDGFKITIHGSGCHGAYPQNGVDPINIGVHVHLALQSLIARETDCSKAAVMTIGQFQAGLAANIIPDVAVMQGTIRTNDAKTREKLVRRMREVTQATAAMYGGSAEVEMISEVPPLVCDPELTRTFARYMDESDVPGVRGRGGIEASASEDFAVVAERVPATFMYISAGYPSDDRGAYPPHHPKVRFNEDVLPVGSSLLATCATRWLEDNH